MDKINDDAPATDSKPPLRPSRPASAIASASTGPQPAYMEEDNEPDQVTPQRSTGKARADTGVDDDTPPLRIYARNVDGAFAVIATGPDTSLYFSDPNKGNWLRTNYSNVQLLRIDADQRTRILTEDNIIQQPQLEHRKAPAAASVQMAGPIRDFAFSAGGSLAFLPLENDRTISLIDAAGLTGTGATVLHAADLKSDTIKPPLAEGVWITSMAFKPNGDLMIADNMGNLHLRGWDEQTLRHEWSIPAAPPFTPTNDPMQPPLQLLGLIGGQAGAKAHNGDIYRLSRDGWSLSSADADTEARATYQQFQGEQRKDNDATRYVLTTTGGGPAQDRRLPELKDGQIRYRRHLPRFAKPDYPGQPMRARWKEWWRAHWSGDPTRNSSFANDYQRYQNQRDTKIGALQSFLSTDDEAERAFQAARRAEQAARAQAERRAAALALQAPPGDASAMAATAAAAIPAQPTPAAPASRTKPPIDEGLRQAAEANAIKILDALQVELMDEKPELSRSRHYAAVHSDKAEQVYSDSNALQLLRRTYGAVGAGGGENGVIQKLDDLLRQGVVLDARNDRNTQQLSRRNNKWGVWTNKLLADAELLTRARDQLPPGPYQTLLDAKNSDSSLINIAFDLNYQSTDNFKTLLTELAYFSGAMKSDDHKLHRAMGMQGQLLQVQKDDLRHGKAELRRRVKSKFLDQLDTLQVGESLSLNSASGGGLDMEGWSQFVKLIKDLAVGERGNVQLWAIEPLASLGVKREHTVTWTRTEDGFDITFGRETVVQAGLGVKSQHGIGGNKIGGRLLGFLYAGNNIKLQATGSLTKKSETKASIKLDDTGAASRLAEKWVNGEMDVEALAAHASMSHTHTATTEFTPKLDIEPLLASGLLWGWAKNRLKPFTTRVKLIAAPLVTQFNFSVKSTSSAVQEISSKWGISSWKWRYERIPEIRGTVIPVLEAQFAPTKGSPEKVGKNKGRNIEEGYDNQFKAPLIIHVYSKFLAREAVTRSGWNVKWNDAGTEIISISETSTVRNGRRKYRSNKPDDDRFVNWHGRRQRGNRGFTVKNLPVLAELERAASPRLLEQVARLKNDSLPIAVTVEFTPEALKRINSQPKPVTLKQLKRRIAREAREPVNSRITSLRNQEKKESRTNSDWGLVAARVHSSAAAGHATSAAEIHIAYRDGEALPASAGQQETSYPPKPGGSNVPPPDYSVSGPLTSHNVATSLSTQRGLTSLLADGGELIEFLQDPIGGNADRVQCAPFVNDLLDKLHRMKNPALTDLDKIERDVLQAFFPARVAGPAGEPQINQQLLDKLLSHPQALQQFKHAIRNDKVAIRASEPAKSLPWLAKGMRATGAFFGLQQDRQMAFARNPFASADPSGANAAEREKFLPYISRVLDQHGTADPDLPPGEFAGKVLDSYFPDNPERATLIASTENYRKKFQRAINRTYQQLDEDQQAMLHVLEQLEQTPEKSEVAKKVLHTLEAMKQDPTLHLSDQGYEDFCAVLPRKRSWLARKVGLTEMNQHVKDTILRDNARYAFFVDGLKRVLQNMQPAVPAMQAAVAPATAAAAAVRPHNPHIAPKKLQRTRR